MKSKCNNYMDIGMDIEDEFLLVSRLNRVVIVGSDSSGPDRGGVRWVLRSFVVQSGGEIA